MVATSAARDVTNRDAFVDGCQARLGIEPDVVSGDEEARLAYDGTLRGLAGTPDVVEPVLVLDIGGGSTELVTRVEAPGPSRTVSRSLDIGSVRLHERFMHGDPPTGSEVDEATVYVEKALDSLEAELRAAGTLVGVDGTIRTMAAVALDMPSYDKSSLHLVRLAAVDVHAVRDRLLAMTVGERRAIPSMHPGRADVIGAGAIVLSAVVDRLGLDDVLVSKHDILDGIAWSVV
jgi:exopolyphosphatase/guanosine-5'-triphosphate,3'-diphosphate pyrophosphatase